MRRRLVVACSAAALSLALVSVAIAAIPNSSTKIFVACMDRYGNIRLIDHQAGKRCTSTEKTLSWNQRGQTGSQGPAGSPGAAGEPGSTGAPGPSGAPGVSGRETVVADGTMTLGVYSGSLTVDCPAGKVPIGGGFSLPDLKDKNVAQFYANTVSGSYPTETGWRVDWIHGIDNLAVAVRAYAICATAP